MDNRIIFEISKLYIDNKLTNITKEQNSIQVNGMRIKREELSSLFMTNIIFNTKKE